MSVQVSYKKQSVMGIFGIVIILLIIELAANIWWVSQINCEFEESEIFHDMSQEQKNQLCKKGLLYLCLLLYDLMQ